MRQLSGGDKNEIRSAVTPDHKGYAAVAGNQSTAAPAYAPPSVPPAVSAPPANPSGAVRPTWAR